MAVFRNPVGKHQDIQDYRDAWFIGFTADFVAGVWLGNDDGSPTKGVTGGSLPARLWRRVMVGALEGVPPSDLPGGEAALVDAASELRDQAGGFIARILRSLGTGSTNSRDAAAGKPAQDLAPAHRRHEP